jgi:hypothetical protein
MTIRIIDSKKVDMSDSEFDMYRNLCRSYDRQNFKGEELFRDLFQSDDRGRVLFIRPRGDRHSSFEVILFMFMVQQHQVLRNIDNQAKELFKEIRDKIAVLDEKIKKT